VPNGYQVWDASLQLVRSVPSQALRKVFINTPETKNIRWPVDPADQDKVMNGFRDKCKVPGCLGAIDGSVIPMKKPTKKQANQDSDSYHGYKGGVAFLLLAVCDIKLRFTYVNAGAPGVRGTQGSLDAVNSMTTLRQAS
jgi:hypothetical protein